MALVRSKELLMDVSAASLAAWIQAVFVAVGVVVALLTMHSNRRTASRRAALDFITRYEIHDPSWPDTTKKAMRVLENRELWGHLFTGRVPQGLNDEELELRRATLSYLNHNELVAIAVSKGALDRDIYVEWFGPAYRNYWERSQSAIMHIREKIDPEAFVHFEKFAQSI